MIDVPSWYSPGPGTSFSSFLKRLSLIFAPNAKDLCCLLTLVLISSYSPGPGTSAYSELKAAGRPGDLKVDVGT